MFAPRTCDEGKGGTEQRAALQPVEGMDMIWTPGHHNLKCLRIGLLLVWFLFFCFPGEKVHFVRSCPGEVQVAKVQAQYSE